MKCTVVFLVLSMVILMAEPGECIWDAVFHGARHFLHRMKCTMLFLVLSMVVLMAEPGEAFIHHIIGGLFSVGEHIHRLIHGRGNKEQQQQQQEQLSQRSFNRKQFERERAAFN
ncbi:pteroicidin-alpha-like [Pelmatolapia mariae]|uniref:pteroicidin-alpha-like n=1 Tax=Pelmatolapia mariae TaxID=158779 RepID=UPI003211F34B